MAVYTILYTPSVSGQSVIEQGHANQEREVAWNVLAHNLWVIARLPRAKAKPKALAKAN